MWCEAALLLHPCILAQNVARMVGPFVGYLFLGLPEVRPHAVLRCVMLCCAALHCAAWAGGWRQLLWASPAASSRLPPRCGPPCNVTGA